MAMILLHYYQGRERVGHQLGRLGGRSRLSQLQISETVISSLLKVIVMTYSIMSLAIEIPSHNWHIVGIVITLSVVFVFPLQLPKLNDELPRMGSAIDMVQKCLKVSTKNNLHLCVYTCTIFVQ